MKKDIDSPRGYNTFFFFSIFPSFFSVEEGVVFFYTLNTLTHSPGSLYPRSLNSNQ